MEMLLSSSFNLQDMKDLVEERGKTKLLHLHSRRETLSRILKDARLLSCHAILENAKCWRSLGASLIVKSEHSSRSARSVHLVCLTDNSSNIG